MLCSLIYFLILLIHIYYLSKLKASDIVMRRFSEYLHKMYIDKGAGGMLSTNIHIYNLTPFGLNQIANLTTYRNFKINL